MTADDLPPAGQPMHQDGNELAGLLASVFVAEFTTLERRCRSCGDAQRCGRAPQLPRRRGRPPLPHV